jgi:hypothetical protein
VTGEARRRRRRRRIAGRASILFPLAVPTNGSHRSSGSGTGG